MASSSTSAENVLGHRHLFRWRIGQLLSALGSYLGIPGPAPGDPWSRTRDEPARTPPPIGSAAHRKQPGPEAPATLDIGGVI